MCACHGHDQVDATNKPIANSRSASSNTTFASAGSTSLSTRRVASALDRSTDVDLLGNRTADTTDRRTVPSQPVPRAHVRAGFRLDCTRIVGEPLGLSITSFERACDARIATRGAVFVGGSVERSGDVVACRQRIACRMRDEEWSSVDLGASLARVQSGFAYPSLSTPEPRTH